MRRRGFRQRNGSGACEAQLGPELDGPEDSSNARPPGKCGKKSFSPFSVIRKLWRISTLSYTSPIPQCRAISSILWTRKVLSDLLTGSWIREALKSYDSKSHFFLHPIA